jgi:uncharacterized membrane protein YphA (DoxX/SURF4 family)
MKYSFLVLRIGLGIVFLWFGIDKIINPLNWAGWVPEGIRPLIPFDDEVHMAIQGVVEGALGALMVAGLFTRIVGIISSAVLLAIIIAIGLNDIAGRDIGLLGGALALAMGGGGELSLDYLIRRQKV